MQIEVAVKTRIVWNEVKTLDRNGVFVFVGYFKNHFFHIGKCADGGHMFLTAQAPNGADNKNLGFGKFFAKSAEEAFAKVSCFVHAFAVPIVGTVGDGDEIVVSLDQSLGKRGIKAFSADGLIKFLGIQTRRET